MTRERLLRLLTWAHRRHPDHPNWPTHASTGDCPWCRSDEPELLEGGAHSTAIELLAHINTLEGWLAAGESLVLGALEDRMGWKGEAVAYLAGLAERTSTPPT